MDLQTICKRIGTITTGFDGFDERPVDCDFMLPDYLPDITAVLKCVMKPMVQSHQISGDRIIVDGTVCLQLLYLDEERRCVHSYEHAQPFTSTFTVKELASDDVIHLSSRVNYVNCRATGPRRVDVHGAFSVGLTVLTQSGCDTVVAAEGDGLFTRGCSISGTVVESQAEKTVSINEVVDLGSAPAETLIRNEASAVITECRQMPEKAVIKGDVYLNTVYVSDSQMGTVCHVKNSIPFSQILDVDGLTEEQLCHCRVRVAQCDARLMQDPGGENRLLSVALKLIVSMECYSTETHEVVIDAYHTTHPLKLTTERVDICQVQTVRSDVVTAVFSTEMPDGDVADIVDLWCDPLTATGQVVDGQARIGGDVLIGMITRDNDGVLSYYERSATYQNDWPEACETMQVTVTPLETLYTRNGHQLEVRLQLAVQCIGISRQSQLAVTQICLDDSASSTKNDPLDGCCLKVCFASAGESVWELARRERTSPEALKAENGLTQEVLEQDMMLLIPMR